MDGIANHFFRSKCTRVHNFACTVSKLFQGVMGLPRTRSAEALALPFTKRPLTSSCSTDLRDIDSWLYPNGDGIRIGFPKLESNTSSIAATRQWPWHCTECQFSEIYQHFIASQFLAKPLLTVRLARHGWMSPCMVHHVCRCLTQLHVCISAVSTLPATWLTIAAPSTCRVSTLSQEDRARSAETLGL